MRLIAYFDCVLLCLANKTFPKEPSPIVDIIVKSLIVASGSRPLSTLSVKGRKRFVTLFIFIFVFMPVSAFELF